MVTDDILAAVQTMIDQFTKADEIGAGKLIMEMLMDFDGDEWHCMSEDERLAWIKQIMSMC